MTVEKTRTRRADLPVQARGRRATDITADVLRAVLDHGPVARSTAARVAGYSAASMTGVANLLIDKGLLREAPEAAGPPGVGRPHVPLAIDTESTAVIGVHLAVPRFTIALLDLRGRVLREHKHEYDDLDPDAVLAQVAGSVRGVLADAEDRRILGIGVATGGWVDAARGLVVEHPLLGWSDLPVRDRLAAETGLPVAIDGHSRALVRAEQLFGAHVDRARSSIVQLFVGNVVDVAFATAGSVQQGPRSAAGAVAHLKIDGLVGRAAAILLDLFDPDLLTVVEAGERLLPQCRALLRAELAAGSTAGAGSGQVVAGTSFPDHVLATAGGAVILDRIYASPTAVPGRFSRAS
jgi:hypothetical protein